MDDDQLPTWLTPEALQEMLRRLNEEQRARAQAPLAIRLRHTLDAAAAQAMSGFPHDNFPDLDRSPSTLLFRGSWPVVTTEHC